MPPNENDYGIVVGINRYRHPYYDDLRGAVNDARDFVRWLKSPSGGNIGKKQIAVHLSDAKGLKPRLQALHDSFHELIKRSAHGEKKSGRRLYIYLAGHGVGTEDVDGAGLLAADHDLDRDSWLPGKIFADMFRKGGLFDEVLLFMDCCRDYDEELTAPHNPFRVQAGGAAGVKRCYGYGAKFDRQSHEEKFGNRYHGVFTRVLMQGLRGRAVREDGKVTAGSLADYVTKKMQDLRPEQEPQFQVDKEVVLAEGLAPARTPVIITLTNPTAGFEIRNADAIQTVLDVVKTDLGGGKWEVQLPPGRLYVVAVPDGNNWFGASKPVKLLDDKIDVTL